MFELIFVSIFIIPITLFIYGINTNYTTCYDVKYKMEYKCTNEEYQKLQNKTLAVSPVGP